MEESRFKVQYCDVRDGLASLQVSPGDNIVVQRAIYDVQYYWELLTNNTDDYVTFSKTNLPENEIHTRRLSEVTKDQFPISDVILRRRFDEISELITAITAARSSNDMNIIFRAYRLIYDRIKANVNYGEKSLLFGSNLKEITAMRLRLWGKDPDRNSLTDNNELDELVRADENQFNNSNQDSLSSDDGEKEAPKSRDEEFHTPALDYEADIVAPSRREHELERMRLVAQDAEERAKLAEQRAKLAEERAKKAEKDMVENKQLSNEQALLTIRSSAKHNFCICMKEILDDHISKIKAGIDGKVKYQADERKWGPYVKNLANQGTFFFASKVANSVAKPEEKDTVIKLKKNELANARNGLKQLDKMGFYDAAGQLFDAYHSVIETIELGQNFRIFCDIMTIRIIFHLSKHEKISEDDLIDTCINGVIKESYDANGDVLEKKNDGALLPFGDLFEEYRAKVNKRSWF